MAIVSMYQQYQLSEEEFENFYHSISGMVCPLAARRHLIAFVFMAEQEGGGLYGRYRFAKAQQKRAADDSFKQAVEFLTGFSMRVDDPVFEDFAFVKLYNAFAAQDVDRFDKPDFKVFSLKENLFSPESQDSNLRGLIEAEHGVLKAFEMDSNGALSLFVIPIIAYGSLVGAIYVFQQDPHEIHLEYLKSNHRSLTLYTTRAYERIRIFRGLNFHRPKPTDSLQDLYAILVELGIEYDFPDREAHIQAGAKPITGNRILMHLKYDAYYPHYLQLLIQEARMVREAERGRIKTAIISIIVDSFAHNIGAHSLIALKWWFQNRFQMLNRPIPFSKREDDGQVITNIHGLTLRQEIELEELKELGKHNLFYSQMYYSESARSDDDVSLLDWIHLMPEPQRRTALAFVDSVSGQLHAQLPMPVDHALYHFFEFMRNKSAFWSGVTRNIPMSGRQKSWTYLLRSFIVNAMFLGTVAHSEGVNTIHIHVELLDEEGRVKVGGEYARVCLDLIRQESALHAAMADEGRNHQFLTEGADFKPLYEAIQQLPPVFLPGELIGQEAMFTILENTLRNIKHYRDALETIRKEGLRMYISIQETAYVRRDGTPSEELNLYKTGVWLHHPQPLVILHSESDKPRAVIDIQMERLKTRIIDQQGRVVLGGSSQDKVCASFLLNGNFEAIEERDYRKAHKHAYPYIFPASEPYQPQRPAGYLVQDDIFHVAFRPDLRADPGLSVQEASEQRAEKYRNSMTAYLERLQALPENDDRRKGIIKKYFHLWKGENCRIVDPVTYSGEHVQYENLSRFRVLAIRESNPDLYRQAVLALRESGIIRIIPAAGLDEEPAGHTGLTRGEAQEDPLYQRAMGAWLQYWLPKQPGQPVGCILQQPSGNDFEPVGMVRLETAGDFPVARYYNLAECDQYQTAHGALPADLPVLRLAHGELNAFQRSSQDHCKIRSHTSLAKWVMPVDAVDKLANADSRKVQAAKLLETINTRITIIDNRIYSLIPVGMEDELRIDKKGPWRRLGQLNLMVYPENGKLFDTQHRTEMIKQTHFLVIHLSFLESIWKNYWEPSVKGNRIKQPYSEDEVYTFFNNEIRKFYINVTKGAQTQLPENFILVITSGRGRGSWAAKDDVLDKEVLEIIRSQVTFRPIEALVQAVEDGISQGDDYQIKHNLCTLLFGS
ncbi:MAG: hypothetical protein NW241_05855 [Bacteroidia bacterium]|nr:hypothetical protein [Bacteroidia bacterium]